VQGWCAQVRGECDSTKVASSAVASRSDVKYSLTEKCENCTTWWPPLSTIAMRLEHAEITASSAFTGRQAALNVGSSVLSNRIARISASSSTRRGRIDTARHRKSRCAYSRFSSSISSSVRPYDSSNVFGKSLNTLRILAGNVRRSLSTWQTTHRNLQHHVSIYRNAQHENKV
jgi:hypothetical protein